MVTNRSTLDGARQALLGVTVFPAILKTLSDLEMLELQRQSVPCGREEEIGFRASSTKAVGRLHCLHLATVRSSSTPFQTCSAAKFSLRNFFTTLLEGTRLLDFWVHYPTLPYSKLKNHYSLGPGPHPASSARGPHPASSARQKLGKRSSATWSAVTSDGWFVHSCEVWFVRRSGIWFVHWFEVWFAHWRALPFRPQSDPEQRLLTCCATKLSVPRWYWSHHYLCLLEFRWFWAPLKFLGAFAFKKQSKQKQ